MAGLQVETSPILFLIKCHLLPVLSTLSKVRCSSFPIASFLSSPIDFIRHGKHHHNRHSAPENTRDLRQQPQNTVTHTPAAARVVDEERKVKSPMPTYQGLENFKLEIKMGECVFDHLSTIHPFLKVTFF